MKLRKIMAFIFMLCAFAAGRTMAASIDFKFEIPTIPYPPQITDISNTAALVGAPSFTVTATIVGQTQMKGYCDVEPRENCTASDWYQAADTDVIPNPPLIQMAKVFYYKNDGVAGAASVDMVYDADLGKYKANIPMTGVVADDKITYYIAAIDTRGNVASQVPDTSQRPCPGTSSWDASLSTPALNSCSYATSYTKCNEYVSGVPSPCSSSYTLGDINGDVCGAPDPSGRQHPISGAQADKVDILGISAGADGTYICTNIGLKAPPPSGSDPTPIEGYLGIFFNPDKFDPNPGDTHITNASAITYAPEAVGSDPTLVKVLWDGDCVTNPNTSNPLNCKLISAAGGSEDLKIEYGGGTLKFMVKKSGTGNPLAVPYSILGSNTKQSVIIGLTGEINLSGGTAFWISDLTPGFAFYQKNQKVTATDVCEPAPPIVTSTRCSVDGTGGTSSKCVKSAEKPAQNKCKINFNKSMDTCVTEYRIYRNTTNSASGAMRVDTVTDNGGAAYNYTDAHTALEGQTYYYFLSSYNAAKDFENKQSDWAQTKCTVEDWVPPEKPVITAAATPPGNEKKCKIDWNITAADPSLQSFFISRDGVPLNYGNPLGAEPGALTFSWSDPATLDLSASYSYTVTATDLGSNTNTSSALDCTPEDFKSPGQISSLVATNYGQSLIGVKTEWQAAGESDIAGYNVYWCRLNNKAIDCRTAASFAKLNSGLLSANNHKAAEDTQPNVFTEEGDYCFYAEACDNCAASGTCPGNNGAANCSGFPAGGADAASQVKCLPLTRIVPLDPPAFPAGLECNAPPEGGKIDVSWNHICHDADGTAFASYDPESGTCINPDANNLVGYKVIFGPRGLVPDYPSATSLNIAGTLGISGAAPTLAHTGLINGQEYCYTAYGVDGAGNFSNASAQFPKSEVCCTPRDIIPPNKPAMREPIDFNSMSCSPSWIKVNDKDPITYNVYGCKGTTAQCANKAAFGQAIATGITEATGLSQPDFEVTTNQEYQYCITATDPSGNESPVVAVSGNTNCGSCTPKDPPVPSVIGVTAGPLSAANNTGAKLFWNKYELDDGGGGYYVYRCSGATCVPKGSAIKSCSKTVPTAVAPLVMDGEPGGDWYYGVTYRTDCGDTATESPFDTRTGGSIDGPIHVDKVCEKCIVVSSCADYDAKSGCIPVTTVNSSTKGTGVIFGTTPVSGYEVFLVDSKYNMIGTPAVTDSDGNYKLVLGNDDNSINLAGKYKILLRVPESDKSGVPCSPTDIVSSDCIIVLDGSVTVTDDGAAKKVYGITLPEPGGGRAEIGNPDCNGYVDIDDLGILVSVFGSSMGDGKYQSYGDFDGSGFIDLDDFVILKQNIGKTLDAAPTFDAALCKPQ